MSKEETVVHRIINDTRSSYEEMDIQEVVMDIARLNYILHILKEQEFDFLAGVIDFRDNLLKFVEEL